MELNQLLMEIGTEELPSSYIPQAVGELEKIATKKFLTAMLPHGKIAAYGSPRRLVLTLEGVPEKQEEKTRKINGPPKKAAIDKDGKPTKVGLGFAKKYGIPFEKVKIENTPKGEYLYTEIIEGNRQTSDVLRELLPQIISEIPFPKTMRWGDGDMRFARPIRSLLALLGRQTINFSMSGVESGSKTFGLRFASDGPITVDSPESYEQQLEEAGVIVNPEKRKLIIGGALDELEKKTNGRVIRDEELLQTICYLTENPILVAGTFNEKYLDLPRELLTTVMKHHQKFFSVENVDGLITNKFVAFSNAGSKNLPTIRKGFERVLSARLSDARFFFDEDRKHDLNYFAEKLSEVRYIKGLGSIADKADRVREIAVKVAEVICHDPDKVSEVEKAAQLCKADLTTSMVYEFPELQGIMGREYAKAQGINNDVATAIGEHYKPRFSGDSLPATDVARSVALADKIEILCGCFALGMAPTGSEDPFSLRRHALGVIRILLEINEKLSIKSLIDWGVETLPPDKVKSAEELKKNLLAFFTGRIKGDFMARGTAYDVIDAVLSAGFEFLPSALKRCEALQQMKEEDYSESLSISFKRASNIVEKHLSSNAKIEDSAIAEVVRKGKVINATEFQPTEVDETLFSEKPEKELLNSLKKREKNVIPLLKAKDYAGALKEIAEIRTAVDVFFGSVMVMADDNKIRNNRLGLLRRVVSLFEDMADFSKLVY